MLLAFTVTLTEADWTRGRKCAGDKDPRRCAVAQAVIREHGYSVSVSTRHAYVGRDGVVYDHNALDCIRAFDRGAPFPGEKQITFSRRV